MAEKLITLSNLQSYDVKIKEYIRQAAPSNVVTLNGVELEKDGETTIYKGTITGTSNDGSALSAEISFDSSDFVRDSFLKSAKLENNHLILTMKLYDESGAEKEQDIDIDLAEFIDAYVGDDETIAVDATSNTISAKTTTVTKGTNGYVAADENALIKASDVASIANAVEAAAGKPLVDGTVTLSETATDHTLTKNATKQAYDLTLVVAGDDDIDALFDVEPEPTTTFSLDSDDLNIVDGQASIDNKGAYQMSVNSDQATDMEWSISQN